MPHINLRLANFVDLEDWLKTQDSFAETLGVALRTVDNAGELLVRPSNPIRFCESVHKESSLYATCCKNSLKKHASNLQEASNKKNLKCPLGLDTFMLPIVAVGSRVLAYVIVGPVILNKRKDESFYRQCAKDSKLDADKLWDSIIEINVFSHNRILAINDLIFEMFTKMAQAGYHKKRLADLAKETVELDPMFTSYYEEMVLRAFLNACLVALDADSGSVMTVDKKTEHIHIKVASKLDENIVKDAEMKMGEGIAGMAAQEAKPIILPNDRDKEGLEDKLKRDYIKSSMVVPFAKGSDPDVYGIINLNIIRKERKFSKQDIELLKEVVNLASIALLPVK